MKNSEFFVAATSDCCIFISDIRMKNHYINKIQKIHSDCVNIITFLNSNLFLSGSGIYNFLKENYI